MYFYSEQWAIKNWNEKNDPIYTQVSMKYLRINLAKDVKDMYTQNNKTLLRKIAEDLKKWEVILRHSWKTWSS